MKRPTPCCCNGAATLTRGSQQHQQHALTHWISRNFPNIHWQILALTPLPCDTRHAIVTKAAAIEGEMRKVPWCHDRGTRAGAIQLTLWQPKWLHECPSAIQWPWQPLAPQQCNSNRSNQKFNNQKPAQAKLPPQKHSGREGGREGGKAAAVGSGRRCCSCCGCDEGSFNVLKHCTVRNDSSSKGGQGLW